MRSLGLVNGLDGWVGPKKCAFFKKKLRSKKHQWTGPKWTQISAFWTLFSAFWTGWGRKSGNPNQKTRFPSKEVPSNSFNPLVHQPAQWAKAAAIPLGWSASCFPANSEPRLKGGPHSTSPPTHTSRTSLSMVL